MKAIRYYRYGPPDVVELRQVDMPTVGAADVLVRVRAVSISPEDWHHMRGLPYLLRATAGLSRPKVAELGNDLAGEVVAVGRDVTDFRPGDDVFGYRRGALAEYITVPQHATLLAKPANLTFEQAAAVPGSGISAVQALRDTGRLQAGQSVLVNGAAGGVGTFAVQIAKAFGAEVTGVCGAQNVDLVRSLGADRVVDYTQEDFTRTGQRHDLMVDMIGNRSLTEIRRVLAPKGTLVVVGGPSTGRWLGPAASMLKFLVRGLFVSQQVTPMLAKDTKADLAVLGELLSSGKLTPVIDRTYQLNEAPEAIGYLETGHARGKVVITL